MIRGREGQRERGKEWGEVRRGGREKFIIHIWYMYRCICVMRFI